MSDGASIYAMSHDTVKISTKRFALSPWSPAYLTDDILMGIYSRRFYPLGTTDDPVADYWHLRRGVALFDVPEHPIEIAGADALTLFSRVFCRDVSKLREGRATYAIACNHQGGILMDGVLMNLGGNRFWYVLADGEFLPWLEAHAGGLDVAITDPDSWVLQVQGPRALDAMPAILDTVPEAPFTYFSVHRTTIDGHPFLISRTGWTGELGFELYPLSPDFDGPKLFNLILERGAQYGMVFASLECMGVRRIEAAIMDNGTDMDSSMTPFDAGLGRFVNLDSDADFIGKAALQAAPRESRFFGMVAPDITPVAGSRVCHEDRQVGAVTAGAWSPYLESGIAFVRFRQAEDWVGREVTVDTRDGPPSRATIVALPFYDHEKRIPRGLANDIP